MAITRLSEDTTETFRIAADCTLDDLSRLDVQLGIEQVVDSDSYFEEAHAYWTQAHAKPMLDATQLEAFKATSMRCSRLGNEQIVNGFVAILDLEEYRQFCFDRWIRLGRLPEPEMEIDLAAEG